MTELTALVAEHNVNVAEADSMALKVRGYKVDNTNNLSDTLHLVEQNEYSLVIADINLGIKNGANVDSGQKIADALRQKLDSGQTRLILISGNDENRALFDQSLGGREKVEYLAKPYSLLAYLKKAA